MGEIFYFFGNFSPIQVYDYMYGLRAVATVAEASEPPPPPGLTAGLPRSLRRASAKNPICRLYSTMHEHTHGNIQPR